MPPRRRTRKSNTQQETEVEDNASQGDDRQSPFPSGTLMNVGPLPSEVNVSSLTSIFPDISLEFPTPEFILRCYKLIVTQAEQLSKDAIDLESLHAEMERKDVELDQALQDRENAITELESTAENVLTELGKAKGENDTLVSECTLLRAELSRLSTSQTSSSQELDILKKNTDEAEKEKRDLVGVVNRLHEDVAQKDEEIIHLRESLKVARKEAQELESSIREVRSTERSMTFKVETMTHQLQLTSEESERINTELSKKAEEFSAYRREKHAEIVQLQSELDSLKQTYNQTSNSLRSLQSSHSSQSRQLSQALQKVEDLTGQLVDQDAKYSSEAANLRRLVQMMEERETQAKLLVEGIEKDWEDLGVKAATREQTLREALEEEQSKVADLEKELDDMKLVMGKINRGELPLPSIESRPLTAGTADSSSNSLLGLSPGLAMITRMQKSGKTFTEVYTEYVNLQDELAKRSLEMERMDRALHDVLADLEEKGPALHQQRLETARVQAESSQLAAQLSQALAERDSFMSQIQGLNSKYTRSEKENTLLQRQLDDLGLQIKVLLKELGRLQDSTIPPEDELENIPPAENVDGVITNSLVLYRSIDQLQDRNQKLLRITRDLSAKIEAEEKEYKEQLDREQIEAIREAHEAIQSLQMQLEAQTRSHQTTVQAYVKERDTLKTMLARYERNDTSTSDALLTIRVNGRSQQPTDVEKELEDMRTNFDAYRHETNVDTSKLREEVQTYQREYSQLSAALAKANAKIDFLNERQRMAQEQYAMQERDYQDLKKRNEQLYDQSSRLEIACTHASDELTNANAQIERLRNECANLRAEKKIWESVQSRIIEENKALSVDRSRMADLIANVQKMHNDMDRSSESDRRRLESQVQNLENQAQELRTQLSKERDTMRQGSMQRDVELQELRSKNERTVEELSKARETLARVEASRQHLQERIDDLVKQVQTKEQKLMVYERRTLAVSETSHQSSEALDNRDLQSEIAELRAALKAAELDLASARSHVEQFKEISQASEAALASLTTTHDEYKASSEAHITKHESEQRALNDRLLSLQEKINELDKKNSELGDHLEKERAMFAQDKRDLEETILDITNSAVSSRSDQATRESEVREQMERAQAAEEKYAREVVAHAESIKVVDDLKQQLKETQTKSLGLMKAVETEQVKFITSEASWKRQREVLDKEITDLNARCKDLSAQNTLLHQHLESVSSQASRIRQAASQSADNNTAEIVQTDEDAVNANGRVVELRSIVSYLRKEKEIVDLQLELSKQENVRLKMRTDRLTESLEEIRSTLSQEREQAAKAVEDSAEHAELLERINQLNILRESNATLRAESDAHARKVVQLESTLAQLRTEVDPIKEELTVLRAQTEEKDRQILRLEDENRQWKERNSQLLTKYDRIDPNDMQALRDEIEDLQIDVRKYEEEKATFLEEVQTKTNLLEETSKNLTEFKARYAKLVEQSRARLGQLNAQIGKLNETVSDLRKQIKDITTERDQLISQKPGPATESSGEIESLKEQIASLIKDKDEAVKLLTEERENSANALTALREEKDKLLSENTTLSATKAMNTTNSSLESASETGTILKALEEAKEELTKARDEAASRAQVAEERAAKADNLAKAIRLQNEKFQVRLMDNEKRRAAESEKLAALTEKHKQEQEEAVATAVAKLRSELQSSGGAEEIAKRHAEELKALEARLATKYETDLKIALEAAKQEASVSTTTEDQSQAIAAATERGRLEAAAKLKAKENQVAKLHNNLKRLEAKIKAWEDAGIVPKDEPSTSAISSAPSAPLQSTPKAPVLLPTSQAVTPTVLSNRPVTRPIMPKNPPALGAVPAVPNKTVPMNPVPIAIGSLPSRPPDPIASGSGRGMRGGLRGARGGVVRGMASRGGGVGRGTPVQLATAAASAAVASNTLNADASNSPGMAIAGAAAKRTREDSDTESLAKRIKPAETTNKPVALRRDRIPTTTPTPPS